MYRLNLATANRVFLVEPQWNPSVENQAVARALRLGQEQAVLVTRYVVDQSIELVRWRNHNLVSIYANAS
jgi:SWI/SNF-related matrix-associated actin-dependent regulator of chromatin subfamily A3